MDETSAEIDAALVLLMCAYIEPGNYHEEAVLQFHHVSQIHRDAAV